MHLARKTFIQQESCERLCRDLNIKSTTYSNNILCQGDNVYYWQNNKSEFHGPAIVIGKNDQQVLIKHGGVYTRVHPCRLQLCQSENIPSTEPQTQYPVIHHNHSIRPSIMQQSISLNHLSDNDSDAYTTADESETSRDVSQNQLVTGRRASNTMDNTTGTGQHNQSSASHDWIHVSERSELPAANSKIECVFPNEARIICNVLSKAGKSTTANWHYLNIQEEDETDEKCCSFRNVSWRYISDVDTYSSEKDCYVSFDAHFDLGRNYKNNNRKMFQKFVEVPD